MRKKGSPKSKKIVFDLDGVICSQTDGNYQDAKPVREAIRLINNLYQNGNKIIIHTSRFMNRSQGDARRAHRLGYAFTKQQLEGWGVEYDVLIFGKPAYDILVDDRAIFFIPDWTLIEKRIKTKLKE